MKRTEFNELKGLEINALLKKVLQTKEELVGLVLEKNMKQLKDKKAVVKKRRDIAQMLTIIKQKQLIMRLETKKEGKK